MNNMFKSAMDKKNPIEFMQNLATHNPDAKNFMGLVSQMMQSGNPEQFIKSLCQQKGIDYNQLMTAYNNFMNNKH